MSEIDIKGDETLVALLLNADKNDIDLLIDYITPDGKFNFSQSDRVKKALRDGKNSEAIDEETLRLLIRELQHFGGNTVINLFRGNGVSYSEIVDDVASHLKIKVAKNAPVKEKESLIIDAVFASSWNKMSDDDRRQLLRDMGINTSISLDKLSRMELPLLQRAAMVASGLAQIATGKALPLIAGLGIGRVLGVLTGPVGLALTGLYTAYDISNPAFRITLPCVVQIAWIRLKNSRHHRLSESVSSTTISTANYDNRWVFENEKSQRVLTVSSIALNKITHPDTLVRHDITEISRLGPLLQTLPSLATAAHIASHHYMEVIIDGALAKVKDGSGYRGFSLGEKGIKAHAVLLNPDKLNQLVNAGILLNVASAILAQKHLADISNKLTQIIETIREISAFQNNARKSEIVGAIQYLQQITPVVIEGQSSPEIRQMLEAIEKDFSTLQDHLLTDIAFAGEKVASINDGSFFSSATITSKIQAQQKIIEERTMEWDLAMKVRGQALHLVSHSEGQTMLVERRQQAIEHHYAQFDTVISKVEKQLQSRIDSISAVAEQANTTSANKVILRKWCNNRLMPQKVAIKEASQAFDQFQQNMLDKSLQTSRMLVEMKDGKPVKCYALPDA
ncbi:YaaW family protein [Escherichia sp. TW09231]|uniref:YaaW family protein n=1 Tax=Escherichia sp. TW09231 TaxID=754327 RepID=UPI0002BA9FAD|nr:YaaW family protein [Escherichia sp. TW09231]